MLNIDSHCGNFKDLPDIKIELKTRKSYESSEEIYDSIILNPEDYLIDGKKIKQNFEQIDKEFLSFLKQDCQPGFMNIDVPAPRGPLFVFGEYFLRKFYTVFDRDRNVVGISVARHENDKNENNQNLIIKTPYDNLDSENLNEKNINGNIIRNDVDNSFIEMGNKNKKKIKKIKRNIFDALDSEESSINFIEVKKKTEEKDTIKDDNSNLVLDLFEMLKNKD